MRKLRVPPVFFLLLALGTAGAAAARIKAANGYKKIVDVHAGIISDMTENSSRYFEALDTVYDYTGKEISAEEFLEGLERARRELVSSRGSMQEYTADPKMAALLEGYGIDPEEYQRFADSRYEELEEFIWSLSSLREFFEEDAKREDYRIADLVLDDMWFNNFYAIRESYLGCQYYEGINYWFADWGEKETSYVREKILPLLPDPYPLRFVWETKRSAAERKAEFFRADREEYYDIEYFGSSGRSLAQERERCEQEKSSPVFAKGSWMNTLLSVKNFVESLALDEDALDMGEDYTHYYMDQYFNEVIVR